MVFVNRLTIIGGIRIGASDRCRPGRIGCSIRKSQVLWMGAVWNCGWGFGCAPFAAGKAKLVSRGGPILHELAY